MTPVTFISDTAGKTEAFIGRRLVGFVRPWKGAPSASWNDVGAVYQLRMPVNGGIEMEKPTRTVISARRTLLHRLAEWHEDADAVLYAAMISALRIQAEGERG